MAVRLVQLGAGILVEQYTQAPTISKLPGKAYSPYITEGGDLILRELTSPFKLPSKIYGKHHKYADMIMSALRSRENPVGVLLLGQKGAGKTLLAHDLCNRAMSANNPVFVIDQPIPRLLLKYLYDVVGGECVFFFDEFCKTYTEAKQRDSLLTFFGDETIKSALFLVLQNETDTLPNAYLNRTGRFLFRIDYKCITQKDAAEIIDDLCMYDNQREFLLDYVNQQAMSQNTLLDLIKALHAFGDTELPELVQILNLPRPVYLNATVSIAISSDTALPDWKIEVIRPDAKELVLVVISPDGRRYSGTTIDMAEMKSGRGTTVEEYQTWKGGILPHPVQVHIRVELVAVDDIGQYRPPILTQHEYVPQRNNDSGETNANRRLIG